MAKVCQKTPGLIRSPSGEAYVDRFEYGGLCLYRMRGEVGTISAGRVFGAVSFGLEKVDATAGNMSNHCAEKPLVTEGRA